MKDKSVYGITDRINFGKYKGVEIKQLLKTDKGKSYLFWCLDYIRWFDLEEDVMKILFDKETHSTDYCYDGYDEDYMWIGDFSQQ